MKYIITVFIAFVLFSEKSMSEEVGVMVGDKVYVNIENRDKYWATYRRMMPVYPPTEQKRKQSACVAVMFTIGKDGNVYDPSVVGIYPGRHGRFENESIKTIKRFKFKPSKINPHRQEVVTTHTFTFIIEEGTKRMQEKRWAELEPKFSAACNIDLEAAAG